MNFLKDFAQPQGKILNLIKFFMHVTLICLVAVVREAFSDILWTLSFYALAFYYLTTPIFFYVCSTSANNCPQWLLSGCANVARKGHRVPSILLLAGRAIQPLKFSGGTGEFCGGDRPKWVHQSKTDSNVEIGVLFCFPPDLALFNKINRNSFV